MLRIANSVSRFLDLTRPVWTGLFIVVLTILSPRQFILPIWAEGVIAGTFIILWIIAGWHDHVWWRVTPLDIPWFLWIISILMSLWTTAFPVLTYEALHLFVAQAIAFWTMIIWVRTPDRARWARRGLLVLGIVLVVSGIFWVPDFRQLYFPVFRFLLLLREQIAFPIKEAVHHNVLAGTLVPFLFLGFGSLMVCKCGVLERIFSMLSVSIVGVILLLLQSRGSWFGILIGIYVYGIMSWRPFAMILFVLLVGIWGGYMWIGTSLPTGDEIIGYLNINSIAPRMEVWSRAIYALQDFPLTGIGMGTFRRVIPAMYPLFQDHSPATTNHAHNLFLQIGVDIGIPGLIAFLAMIGATGRLARRAWQLSAFPDLTWTLRGVIAGLIAVLGHGMVDATVWNTRPAFLVWSVWGLGVGIALTLIQETQTDAQDEGHIAFTSQNYPSG